MPQDNYPGEFMKNLDKGSKEEVTESSVGTDVKVQKSNKGK